MNRRGFVAGVAAMFGSLLAACSPLTALNTLSPRDPAAKAGRDIAYGQIGRAHV